MDQTQTLPSTWRDLVQAFSQDAASPRVDALAAELTARVVAAGYELCLGLVRPEVVARYYGLTYLLDDYGLTLLRRFRADGRGVFLYAALKKPEPSEWGGARVLVRRADNPLAVVA